MAGHRFVDGSVIRRRMQETDDRYARELAARHPVVVDVAIVPTSTNEHGVVDVALEPSDTAQRIGRLTAALDTLAMAQAVPRAPQKPATKLARAIATKAARLADTRALEVWAKAVKTRDDWKDRKTGETVRSTRQLDPLRAEAHHIAGKDDWAVRYDPRNGLCLSFATHYAVTTNQLRIEGTAWFTVDGCRYIDATHPVTFVVL